MAETTESMDRRSDFRNPSVVNLYSSSSGTFLRRLIGLSFAILLLEPQGVRWVSAEDRFPRFTIVDHEVESDLLNRMHVLHHDRAFTRCTLWDAWLPKATLWASQKKREQYSHAFLNRRIDDEGYVSMQQHRGMAHSEGWPFPAWQQSTGVGFHFSNHQDSWAIKHFRLKPLTNTEGWKIEGASVQGIDAAVGLKLKATKTRVSITTPAFRCGTIVAPFLRLEWNTPEIAEKSPIRVEWLLEGESKFPIQRIAEFSTSASDGMHYRNLPMHRHVGYAGVLNRYRISFETEPGSEIELKSIITAIDTRHPITGALFVRGSADLFHWTGDKSFLKQNLPRMRKAMRYTLQEFSVRKDKHVFVPWVGHGGRSGIVISPDGKKTARPGLGVGNNYWDLIPFGGHDAFATMYIYDALRAMADIERAASAEGISKQAEDLKPESLDKLANEVRDDFQARFWNHNTGRFVGWIDVEDHAYDYGFTFFNLEAIHHGLASEEQTTSIMDWIDGVREVATDTSRGKDIYHWRFGARSTTLRNVQTYVWPWFNPEAIPWGYQVQDGGAVLGFSFFDLMARLKSKGPDDAWKRLSKILDWFSEVEQEGGYRAYYSKPERGTLQGGGPPGGLGVDREFFESVLVPQVMLYGFMGVEPTATGLRISPRLPSDWPGLSITNIQFQEHRFDLHVDSDTIRVKVRTGDPAKLSLILDSDSPIRVVVQ